MNRLRPDTRTLCLNEIESLSEFWSLNKLLKLIITKKFHNMPLLLHGKTDRPWSCRSFFIQYNSLAGEAWRTRRTLVQRDKFSWLSKSWRFSVVLILQHGFKGSKLGVKSDYDHSAIFGPTWVNIESKFGLAILLRIFE